MKTMFHEGVVLPILPIISDKILKAISDGSYERNEVSQINRIIQDQERIIEIGVGLGFISTLVLKNPKTEQFLGFEANPQLIEPIRTVFEMNNVNGEVVNAVLNHDQETREMDFYIRNDFWASSLEEKPWGYNEIIKVKTILFNSIIEEFKPTMIICDIEGGELALFRDACLIGVKKVYMEIHQQVLGRRGVRRLFDVMSSKGFHYDQWHSSGSVILFSHIDR
jgi:FkbM family methyltransferase